MSAPLCHNQLAYCPSHVLILHAFHTYVSCSQILLIYVFLINSTGLIHTWPLLLLLAFFHLQFPWITVLFSPYFQFRKEHAVQPSSPFHTWVIGSTVGCPGVGSKQLWRKEVGWAGLDEKTSTGTCPHHRLCHPRHLMT